MGEQMLISGDTLSTQNDNEGNGKSKHHVWTYYARKKHSLVMKRARAKNPVWFKSERSKKSVVQNNPMVEEGFNLLKKLTTEFPKQEKSLKEMIADRLAEKLFKQIRL